MSESNYKDTPEYQKGLEVFASKYEKQHGALLEKLYAFSPELADVVVAHGLNDIWVNKTKQLTVREKEIAVLSSLITSCTVHSEIKAHAQCLLNIGVTKEQIKGLLVLLTLYIGVPKVITAMKLIDEAFTEHDAARSV